MRKVRAYSLITAYTYRIVLWENDPFPSLLPELVSFVKNGLI